MNHKRVFKVCLCAIMVAVSFVLCRYLGFPQNGTWRIEAGFLPILVVAVMFGPIWGGIAYGLSDLIGAIIFTGVNPFITLCKVLFGVIMGLLFYKKTRPGFWRIFFGFLLIAVLDDIVCMTPIFVFGFHQPFGAAITARGLGALANLPIRVLLSVLLFRFCGKTMEKYMDKNKSFAGFANSPQHIPRLGLERISCLCRLLGDPQKDLRCIHVAGTNGKGSICVMLDSILREQGLCVGKYVSPNLLKVNERISVNGVDITDKDYTRLLKKIRRVADKVEKETGESLSQFEIWTALAFLHFKEKKCDIVVLETGLGGEFDATNVISSNVMSVFAHIDLDHMAYLGDTVEKIALTKSKIIKKDCETHTVVSAKQTPAVAAILEAGAKEMGCEFLMAEDPVLLGFEEIYEKISYKGLCDLKLSLGGIYQPLNASVAIECARVLGIPDDIIRRGMSHLVHHARFEVISKDPTVIYDGAHNPDGMRVFKKSVDRYFGGMERIIIFACMRDKDIAPSLSLLNDGLSRFCFTTVQGNSRAMTTKELCDTAKALGIEGTTHESLANALSEAKQIAAEKHIPIFICGSLYFYQDLF